MGTPIPLPGTSLLATDINEERKHLEGLLKDRINFHLLFAGFFMAGLAAMDDPKVRVWALGVMTLISVLIALAVYRTHELVRQALEDMKTMETPYQRYYKRARFRLNANSTLLWVPIVLSISFAAATGFYFHRIMKKESVSAATTCVYQIEDRSDRRVLNGVKPPEPSSANGKAQKAKHLIKLN